MTEAFDPTPAAAVGLVSNSGDILTGLDYETSHTIRLAGHIGEDRQLSCAAVRNVVGDVLKVRPLLRHLHVVIDSDGGSIKESELIYRFLRALPLCLSMEIGKECSSAAITVLMAASLRMCRRDAKLLIHPARIFSSDLKRDHFTAQDFDEYAERLRRLDDEHIELLWLRTGADRDWVRAESETEALLAPALALQTGLIHEIPGIWRIADEIPETDLARGFTPAGYGGARITIPRWMRTAGYREARLTRSVIDDSLRLAAQRKSETLVAETTETR